MVYSVQTGGWKGSLALSTTRAKGLHQDATQVGGGVKGWLIPAH